MGWIPVAALLSDGRVAAAVRSGRGKSMVQCSDAVQPLQCSEGRLGVSSVQASGPTGNLLRRGACAEEQILWIVYGPGRLLSSIMVMMMLRLHFWHHSENQLGCK